MAMPAFMSALDLKWTEWNIKRQEASPGMPLSDPKTNKPITDKYELVTQAQPPNWNFKVGDLLHSNREMATGPWKGKKRGYSVRIEDKEGPLLVIAIHNWEENSKETRKLTQTEFVKLLKEGVDTAMRQDSNEIEFVMEGSAGDEYVVTASLSGGRVALHCNCPGGQRGGKCHHRDELLNGDVSALLSDNADDLQRVIEAYKATSLPKIKQEIDMLDAQIEDIKKRKKGLESQFWRLLEKGAV